MKSILSLISKIHEKGNHFILEELKRNGAEELSPSHGDILIVLYKNNRATMSEISEKIHRTKPTVTVLVNKLEKLGYVKRYNSEIDGRTTYITLTEKGNAFRDIFKKISNNLEKMLCKNLTNAEINMLEEFLKKI